ncbi:MAG: hypothetical protein C0462_12285 [Alcanivorax sp.]|nr:hypothetical protein [Alcanivorax sp.]
MTPRYLHHPHQGNPLSFFSDYHDQMNRFLANEIFDDELYAFDTDKSAPVILDGGANIGLSILYFKRRYPQARIVAYEPEPAYVHLAHANVALHALTDVEIRAQALGRQDGPRAFYGFSAPGMEIPVASLYPNARANRPLTVQGADVLRVVNELGDIDLIKLDIEGGECDIVERLAEGQALRKARHYVVEYHRWVPQTRSQDEFIRIFEQQGFSTQILQDNDIHPDFPDISGNAVIRFSRQD